MAKTTTDVNAKRQALKVLLTRLTITMLLIWGVLALWGLLISRIKMVSLAKSRMQIVEFAITEASAVKKPATTDTAAPGHKAPQGAPSGHTAAAAAASPPPPPQAHAGVVVPSANQAVAATTPTDQAKPAHSTKDRLAIIVTGLGMNKYTTEQALKLPKKIGLGFVPYVGNLKSLVYNGVNQGFEVFIYLPFQTANYPFSQPGGQPILLTATTQENTLRINSLLNDFAGIKGVYAAPDEVITKAKEIIVPLMQYITNNNLVFINSSSNKTPDYLGRFVSLIKNVSLVVHDDGDADVARKDFEKLVEVIHKNHSGIAYFSSSPASLGILTDWISKLPGQNIELVDVSEIAN